MDPVVVATVRAALALLFGVAAAHKLRDVRRFRTTLAEYRVLPAWTVPAGAATVVAAESAVAGALAVPALARDGLVGAATLLLAYAAAVGVNLWRGRLDLDCGCAGPAARRPIGGSLVVRNVVVAVIALAALAPVRIRPLGWLDAVTMAAATAALAALYAAVDRMAAHGPALARLRVRR